MTAATYPARHEAIRKVLMERGYTQVWYRDPDRGGALESEGWFCREECPSEVWLSVVGSKTYEESIENAELRLGLRLPPDVQRHVDAERARCVAILRALADREGALATAKFADGNAHAASVLAEAMRAIESGEVPA